MKTKTVKRHYCDHCGKGGQSAHCIRRHESTCVYNPDRVCPLCSEEHASGALLSTKETVATLIAEFRSGGVPALRQKADGCPACMLAAIVQARGKQKASEENWIEGFSYKKELEDWRTEKYPPMPC